MHLLSFALIKQGQEEIYDMCLCISYTDAPDRFDVTVTVLEDLYACSNLAL